MFTVTSPASPVYNCIAWAAGDATRWWWPDAFGFYYWPDQTSRSETLDAFTAMFRGLGYEICEGSRLEAGFEKVAIYVDGRARPTHAARQLDNGNWTSKLGQEVDIQHDGPNEFPATCSYGVVARFMRRPSLPA